MVANMDIQRFKRHDRDFEYIAHRFTGAFGSLPSWFDVVERNGLLRKTDDGFHRSLQVKVITGAWQTVELGDWVVLQKGGADNGSGFPGATIWCVGHEDFNNLWDEVK